MPTREDIQQEIAQLKGAGQDSIRHKYLGDLNAKTGRDTIVYFSSYNTPRPFPVPPQAHSITLRQFVT